MLRAKIAHNSPICERFVVLFGLLGLWFSNFRLPHYSGIPDYTSFKFNRNHCALLFF